MRFMATTESIHSLWFLIKSATYTSLVIFWVFFMVHHTVFAITNFSLNLTFRVPPKSSIFLSTSQSKVNYNHEQHSIMQCIRIFEPQNSFLPQNISSISEIASLGLGTPTPAAFLNFIKVSKQVLMCLNASYRRLTSTSCFFYVHIQHHNNNQ